VLAISILLGIVWQSEPVTLRTSARLTVAGHTVTVPLRQPVVSVRVVELDRQTGTTALLVEQTNPGEEDPPTFVGVALLDGGTLRYQELGYRTEAAQLPGDGSIHLRRDDCPRMIKDVFTLIASRFVRTAHEIRRYPTPNGCAG
jgi:hypothetical protein